MKRIQGALRNRGLLYFYMSTSKVRFIVIRIITMSTKMSWLLVVSVELGTMVTCRVSYAEKCITLRRIYPIMLLRPTSQDWSNIIRIFTMSTKMVRLSRFKVESGPLETRQVSWYDLWLILLLPHGTLLLRRTRKKSHSYTDEHDVDEDLRTILAHGGFWTYDNTAGIMYRDVRRENFYHFDVVASVWTSSPDSWWVP